MKKVKLIKLSDDTFNGLHPNGIYAGYIKSGFEINSPVIGKRYYVDKDFSTSPVQTLPDENGVFKTLYSTYKLEYIDDKK